MPLKKRYSLPAGVITHLFDGEVSGTSFSGFHSEARKSPDNGRMRITSIDGTQNARRLANKPYRAEIEINVGGGWRGSELKSMFPKDWTEADIIRMIEQSLTDPGDSARPSREAWTSTPRKVRGTGIAGQKITRIRIKKVACVILYEGGSIASVYPNIV